MMTWRSFISILYSYDYEHDDLDALMIEYLADAFLLSSTLSA